MLHKAASRPMWLRTRGHDFELPSIMS